MHWRLDGVHSSIPITARNLAGRSRMDDKTTLNEALDLMRDLRQRCEWDAAQTHESLRPYLIEEAYELDEAIRSGTPELMREELGDVLLQVLFHSGICEERASLFLRVFFHAVMGEEGGKFNAADGARSLTTKMRARHPHLYGDG